jgi:CheY-like chemotaxis protein
VALQGGSGTILIVDDEALVAELTRDILVRFGYTVLTAHTGEDAVTLYEKQSREIKLVLLDLVMPGMDGKEVLRKLRAIDPAAKVLLSSGYSKDDDSGEWELEGVAGFVQKPFRLAELLRSVNAAIAAPLEP